MPVERKKATQKSPSLHLLITFPCRKKNNRNILSTKICQIWTTNKKDHPSPMIWAKIGNKSYRSIFFGWILGEIPLQITTNLRDSQTGLVVFGRYNLPQTDVGYPVIPQPRSPWCCPVPTRNQSCYNLAIDLKAGKKTVFASLLQAIWDL